MDSFGGSARRPRVDVIVDNFDYGRFLGWAIDSALSQTYADVNVIVVDDGSTDESRDVIAQYGDRIDAVLKDNGGQGSAFNAGMTRSAGEIVVFLDADDMLLPQAAERIVGAFRSRPDAAKVHYRMEVVDSDGRPTGELKPPRHVALPSGNLRKATTCFPFDLAWLPTSGNAFSADVLRRIAPVPEVDFPILADYYLVHLAALFGPVIAVDEPLAQFRVHGANRHEPDPRSMDLDNLRRTIDYTERAKRHIRSFALLAGVGWSDDAASMSEIANRAISLKLAPSRHPISGDTRYALLRRGLTSARARWDVSTLFKLTFACWLITLTVLPRRAARPLAEVFVYPGRRTLLNPWLRQMHRGR